MTTTPDSRTELTTALEVSHAGYGWHAAEEQWKLSMRAWHGLKPAPGMDWYRKAECPHWLTTHGHRGERTVCRRPWWAHRGGLIWDHPRAWLDTEGRRVITLEPYWSLELDLDAGYISELRDELAPMGIEITTDPRGPYGTDLVVFLQAQP